MNFRKITWTFLCLFLSANVYASVLANVEGVVHDPQHRPVAGARVALKSTNSDYSVSGITNSSGVFHFNAVALGDYKLHVEDSGFAPVDEDITVLAETSQVLHVMLEVASVKQTVEVQSSATSMDTVTPTSLIDRSEIAKTPGASRTYGMQMITDYVPGAYMTHDMLHMRGGHQLDWLLDGVAIPNTKIAANLAPQIAPSDIDYIEAERGSYSAGVGDRTYGVFNVLPRSGFERDHEAELSIGAGNFLQSNVKLSFGDHSQKSAYYASVNGDRSDYVLAPPIEATHHDAGNGYGGLFSYIHNQTAKDQFRWLSQARQDFFQIPYDPNINDYENQLYDSSALRDAQRETDALSVFTWVHTASAKTEFQLSPFYHYNQSDYRPGAYDTSAAALATGDTVSTKVNGGSNYAGAQINASTVFAHNHLDTGLYGWGEHDSYLFGVNDPNNPPPFSESDNTSGGLFEAFISDAYKPTQWVTITAGIRETHFQSSFNEDKTSPRLGLAVLVPKLNWVFRGFYGRFYQPPPLITASGPIQAYATNNNVSLIPLHGEWDEEHQFGVQMPYRGWLLDVDTFKTRANNFLDHSNIGNSSLYFPITVDGALVRAWELTLRSPRVWRYGQAHVAYSNQIAEQRGAITGGLICYSPGLPSSNPSSPCYVPFTYTPLDHDQRNTLNVGFNADLPKQIYASANVYYGSGFSNGYPTSQFPASPYAGDYLPQHTTFDLSTGKSFGNFSVSANVLNVANRRVLLDNSLTYGGFHYNDPRQIYGEVKYRFHYRLTGR